MRRHLFFPLFACVASLAVSALPQDQTLTGVSRRQVIEPLEGTIAEPAEGTTISTGSVFPFLYWVDNICEAAYTPYTVWIVPGPDPPTPSSLNSSEGFSNGTYLANLGSYVIANFGYLGTEPVLPPPNFTTPDLGASAIGTTVYLTVVQVEIGCPPDGYTEWGISSVGLEYEG